MEEDSDNDNFFEKEEESSIDYDEELSVASLSFSNNELEEFFDKDEINSTFLRKKTSIYHDIKQIKKDSGKNIYNRLRSIQEDKNFVNQVIE